MVEANIIFTYLLRRTSSKLLECEGQWGEVVIAYILQLGRGKALPSHSISITFTPCKSYHTRPRRGYVYNFKASAGAQERNVGG